MGINPHQKAAVNVAGHAVVSACPGSGKTTVLVERVVRLLGASDASVAVVTFTKDAAREIQARLRKRLGERLAQRAICGTFHGLSLALLRRHEPISPIAEAQQIAMVVQAIRKAGVTDMNVDQALDYIVSQKSTYPANPPVTNCDYGLVYREYQVLCHRNGVMDFADLINTSTERIESCLIDPLPVGFMLVDEFQDTDQCQLAWVMAHKNRGCEVLVVGDDDQSIYGWRNAMGYSGMSAFARQSNATMLTLPINYRCCPEILNAAKQLIEHNSSRITKAIEAARTEAGSIHALEFVSQSNEARACVDYIATTGPGDWAVLARTKSLLGAVERELNVRSIDCHRIGGSSFWEKPLPETMLNLLQALQYGQALGVLSVLQWAGFLSDSNARHPSANQSADAYVEQLLVDHPGSDGNSEGIKAFAEAWEGWRETLSSGLVDVTIGAVGMWMKGRVGARVDDTEKALVRTNIIRDSVTALKRIQGTLPQRLNTVRMSGQERKGSDCVRLMTLHASKGLEFDRVWMIGCNDSILPHSRSVLETGKNSTEGMAEERRLCYVGMTRARNELFLSCSGMDRLDQKASNSLQPSPFIAEAGLSLIRDGENYIRRLCAAYRSDVA